MKYFTVIFALIALAMPVMAEDQVNRVLMKDFDKSLQGFSFTQGGLVKLDPESDGFPMEVDFIFDMPPVLV